MTTEIPDEDHIADYLQTVLTHSCRELVGVLVKKDNNDRQLVFVRRESTFRSAISSKEIFWKSFNQLTDLLNDPRTSLEKSAAEETNDSYLQWIMMKLNTYIRRNKLDTTKSS